MRSINGCCLFVLITLTISQHAYGASKSRTSTSAQISDLSRKLSRLEQKVSTLQRDVDLLKKTNGQLTNSIKTANNEIQRVSTRNNELQQMLDQFEKFFGTLYSESDIFDNPIATSVDKKLNELNTYIGNKEATLIEANPNYVYTVLGVEPEKTEANVTDELVEKAVVQLATDNAEMQKKVNDLEARVAEVDKSSSRGINADDFGLTNDRLDKLEDIVSRIIELDQPNTAARTTEQQQIYDDMIEDVFITERSVSTSRKSVFSASRSTELLGTVYSQVITFDFDHVNKGRDFVSKNGTFHCQWTGYYFFTFTLRTHDGHFMGVNLIKTSGKNHTVITSIYTDAHSRNTMETQSIAVHLKAGDIVWLRLGPSDRFAVYSDEFRYITFTGFLIYKGN
ncbi:uncharacterized protein [Antedon mediterranea]|uniref:uncharacterized protein n=1 Tax=Antedon mediterranea TaxID=105859 RepID=UPI003AF4636A